MAGSAVDEARDRFQSFLEPVSVQPEHADPTITVDIDDMADVVKARLRRRFQELPGCVRLAVYGDGQLIGTATRALILGPESMAGGEVGGADGAAFPLGSNDFRALLFRCSRRACAAWAYRSFFDERTNPVCADHVGVPMRLV